MPLQFIITSAIPEEFFPILEYRYNMMDLVDNLCALWNISPPDGKKCHEFFEKEWYASVRFRDPGVLDRFEKVGKLIY
jgi:hypothetical protein